VPTQVQVPLWGFLKQNWLADVRGKLRAAVGFGYARLEKYFLTKPYRKYVRSNRASQRPRLSPDDIQALAAYIAGRDYRQMTDRRLAEARSGHWSSPAVEACGRLLAEPGSEISSVVNIGARVDFFSSSLARRFPQVTFTSVDFPPDLAQMNRFLPAAPNWSFVSGYPLEVIERGQVRADLATFIGSALLATNPEMRAYFKALAQGVKYIFINEPWGLPLNRLNFFKLPRPEDIDPQRSAISKEGYYIHNYPALLQATGFEVVSAKIGHCGQHYLLLIARRAG